MKLIPITLSTLLALNVSALAEGDIKKGKKVFKKCAACHTVKEDKHKLGPSLYGVFGRTAGTVEGVKYSEAMVASGIIWDEINMREFLTKPKDYIKGTSMAFGGIKKEKQLLGMIFLRCFIEHVAKWVPKGVTWGAPGHQEEPQGAKMLPREPKINVLGSEMKSKITDSLSKFDSFSSILNRFWA